MNIQPSYLSVAKNSEAISNEDIAVAIEYAFGHRKVAIQEFLKQYSISTKGKKEQLRNAVVKAVRDGEISNEDIIGFLDSLEGWGNQHIYLFSSPANVMTKWKSKASAKKLVKDAGFEDLFNCRRPLVLPDEPTLASVEWTKKRVRFVWIDRREWYERIEEEDEESKDGEILYKAYRHQITRGVTSFDWNLVSGDAALMIQTLPRGENYDDVRKAFEAELAAFIDLNEFTRCRITKAIKKLESSKEALNRKIELLTRTKAIAAYTSKGRKTDAYEDEDLKKSRKALGERTTSKSGNFYFQPTAKGLDRAIHVKLYTADQRVGLFGECTESEVQYVLSRVRQHIK